MTFNKVAVVMQYTVVILLEQYVFIVPLK